MKITRASLCFGAAALILPFGSQAHAQDEDAQQGLAPVAFLEWREIGPAVVGGRVSEWGGASATSPWMRTTHGSSMSVQQRRASGRA